MHLGAGVHYVDEDGCRQGFIIAASDDQWVMLSFIPLRPEVHMAYAAAGYSATHVRGTWHHHHEQE